jgi:N,N-dimethylformamidase
MILGYPDQLSVAPGETVRLMISTDQPTFEVETLRLRHGDPNPEGPGFRADELDWLPRGPHRGVNQPLQLGSYAILPGPGGALQALTFGCWLFPTSRTYREEPVLDWGREDGPRLGLRLTGSGRIAAGLNGDWVENAAPLVRWHWHYVGLVLDTTRRALQVFCGTPSMFGPEVAGREVTLDRPFRADPPLILAAERRGGSIRPGFNGKLGRPTLLGEALAHRDLGPLMYGMKPRPTTPLLGEWDFSREIATTRLVDISGHDRHGTAHQAPARGVTGVKFTGPSHKTYADAPAEYDAIHFHDDDLEDAGWQPVLELRVPADARSGIYSVHATAGGEDAWLTFLVRGRTGKLAPVLFLVPTMTWHAYSNMSTPQYGLSLYTAHSDGSPNHYATLRKPLTSFVPDNYYQGMGKCPRCGAYRHPCAMIHWVTGVMASLYTIHWLEHLGIEYEVLADHDLDAQQPGTLADYRVVLNVAHSEYWTEPMLNTFAHYLEHGGRVMHLAGNALYWVSSLHPQRRHLMEIRRADGTWPLAGGEPGELQHACTGTRGGMWVGRGRAPQQTVGLGFVGMGLSGKGAGFRRLKDSFDPRAKFIFEGVGADELIGDFGLNQGAAAGVEIDATDPALGTPPGALVLAASVNHSPAFVLPPEELVRHGPDDRRIRAEMIYAEKPNGGALFAVGSISWTGSLSHHNYDNNVARISTNVLREFLK